MGAQVISACPFFQQCPGVEGFGTRDESQYQDETCSFISDGENQGGAK